MKRDFLYLALILFVIAGGVKAKQFQSIDYGFEEQVHHGMHYGLWMNRNQEGGYFVVRCFDVDSAAAHPFMLSKPTKPKTK